MANCLYDLEVVLTDLKFISFKCGQDLAAQLMDDFDLYESNKTRQKLLSLLAVRPKKSREFSQKFFDYKEFITQKYHLLVRDPKCIYQEAMNEPVSSQVAIDLDILLKSGFKISGNLFEWPMKLVDFSEGIVITLYKLKLYIFALVDSLFQNIKIKRR